MSNKRNQRRRGQRVRAEIGRGPVVVSKALEALVAAQPGERERKEKERRWKRPTKIERRESELARRRWFFTGDIKRVRKPRTKHGATFWRHSLDA